MTAASGLNVPIYGTGVAVADYDGDGDSDLFLAALGRNRMYRNDGGRFLEGERRAVAEVVHDERGLGPTVVVEPEQLLEGVGRAGVDPPELDLARLVRAVGGMREAAALEQRRDRVDGCEAGAVLLSHRRRAA